MQLHLLLTDDIKETMPNTCKITDDFGKLDIVFDNADGKGITIKTGLHCFVEDTTENIIKWLKPFDGFIKGNGYPMMETFEICHIK